jgi:hypothetical protein
VHVDIPVLTPKDVRDLQQFCCANKMDFVAASFVQSAEDVMKIRAVLDEAGGQAVRIISKIENEAGLERFDEILRVRVRGGAGRGGAGLGWAGLGWAGLGWAGLGWAGVLEAPAAGARLQCCHLCCGGSSAAHAQCRCLAPCSAAGSR